jgi:hypothetical protein
LVKLWSQTDGIPSGWCFDSLSSRLNYCFFVHFDCIFHDQQI